MEYNLPFNFVKRSVFSRDQSEFFCDPDWVEKAYDDSGDLRKVITDRSYFVAYLEDVVAFAREIESWKQIQLYWPT